MNPAAAEKLKAAWRAINQNLGCPTCMHHNGQLITRGLCCKIGGPWLNLASHCCRHQERSAPAIENRKRRSVYETLTGSTVA